MDWNAPHVGFVIISYVITFLALVGVIWSSLRISKRRAAELEKLENEIRQRKSRS